MVQVGVQHVLKCSAYDPCLIFRTECYSFSLGLWAPVVFPSKHFVFPISCWVRLLCSLLMNICVLVLVSKLVFCFSRLTHESLRWWVAWDPVFYGVGKHLRLTQWMSILLQLKYWNPLAECFLGTLANTPDWPNHCAFSCCGWNIGFGHHHILERDKGLYVGCRLVGNMLCPLPSPLCKVLSCVLALAASCVQHQHHVLTWGASRSVLPHVRSASCKVLRWAACDSAVHEELLWNIVEWPRLHSTPLMQICSLQTFVRFNTLQWTLDWVAFRIGGLETNLHDLSYMILIQWCFSDQSRLDPS